MAIRRITILDLRDSLWADGPGRTALETAPRIDQDKYRIIVAGVSGGTQKTGEYLHEAERRGLPVIQLTERGKLGPGDSVNVMPSGYTAIDDHLNEHAQMRITVPAL